MPLESLASRLGEILHLPSDNLRTEDSHGYATSLKDDEVRCPYTGWALAWISTQFLIDLGTGAKQARGCRLGRTLEQRG